MKIPFSFLINIIIKYEKKNFLFSKNRLFQKNNKNNTTNNVKIIERIKLNKKQTKIISNFNNKKFMI